MAGKWLKECRDGHPACQKSDRKIPNRLINAESTTTIKLCETSGHRDLDYVALSHCWGTLNQFQTTTTNLENRKTSIEWDCLPKTFQDAITIAQSLGYTYIWIDSLCILQDSRQDWEAESARMGDIYENAALTIAATSSPSDESGFLGVRTSNAIKVINFLPPGDGTVVREALVRVRKMTEHYVTPIYADAEPAEGRLNSRAWAYLERLLARRVLAFHKNELLWECNAIWDCECGHNSFAHKEKQRAHPFNFQEIIKRIGGERTYYNWRNEIVPAYSSRDLTFASDRLLAISAVASKVQRVLSDEYIGALWKTELPRQLLWEPVGSWSSTKAAVTSEYRAPSFSWASVDVVVAYREYATFQPLIEVLETSCIPSGPDPMGQLSHARIRVSGLLARLWIRVPPKPYIDVVLHLYMSESFSNMEQVIFLHDAPLKIGDFKTTSGRKTRRAQRSHEVPCGDSQDDYKDAEWKTWEVAPVWCLFVGEGTIDKEFYRASFVQDNLTADNGKEQMALILSCSASCPNAYERLGIINKRENERHRPGIWENLMSKATRTEIDLV